jgi:hypothetical protein
VSQIDRGPLRQPSLSRELRQNARAGFVVRKLLTPQPAQLGRPIGGVRGGLNHRQFPRRPFQRPAFQFGGMGQLGVRAGAPPASAMVMGPAAGNDYGVRLRAEENRRSIASCWPGPMF